MLNKRNDVEKETLLSPRASVINKREEATKATLMINRRDEITQPELMKATKIQKVFSNINI